MKELPLVSVVCLCYNQSRWLDEAVMSVLNQTYKNVQLIIVDDASTDDSVTKIKRLKDAYPSIEIILSAKNRGNCAAFNEALKKVTGDFVIDFAADDVMMPTRIERQIEFFKQLDSSYGVVFTNAEYIDATGRFIRNHYDYLFQRKLLSKVPQGDVYRDVLSTYFIASPTMMVRKEVFDKIGGYDEALAYEDFDFWVRSSRIFKYRFLDESLTKVRRTGLSMSSGWYKVGDRQLHSTYLVCCKAIHLNRDEDDVSALLKRVRYEMRQSVFSENHDEAHLFYELLRAINRINRKDKFLMLADRLKLPLKRFRSFYYSIRFKRGE
ncbi:MAG TPA: glycosyltransferase [Cyclobacteriaceae bacterium]|nr:glycosyltransferase [Cyclobacteriaceae bacterium]